MSSIMKTADLYNSNNQQQILALYSNYYCNDPSSSDVLYSVNEDASSTISNTVNYLSPYNTTYLYEKNQVSTRHVLLSDKKEFFEHLKPRNLTMSTVRTAATQAAQVVITYYQDLLTYKLENENLIAQEKISQKESDDIISSWEKEQWEERVTIGIPQKIKHAIIKSQCITLCMRGYELLLDTNMTLLRCSNKEVMDLLTRDVVSYARQQAIVVSNRYQWNYYFQLFHVCLWSSCIHQLSDATVSQLFLCLDFCQEYWKETKESEKSSNMLSNVKILCVKSGKIIMIRFVSWIVSSAASALGSVVYPKFGTVLGNNLGDTAVSSLLE